MTSRLGESGEIVVTVTSISPSLTSNQVGANQKMRWREVALTMVEVEEIRFGAQE